MPEKSGRSSSSSSACDFQVGRSAGELSPHDRPRHERSRQGRFEDVARPLRHHPNWNMHAACAHLSALRLDKTDKYLSLG